MVRLIKNSQNNLRLRDVRARATHLRSSFFRRSLLAVFVTITLGGTVGSQVFGEQLQNIIQPTQLRVLKDVSTADAIPAVSKLNNSTTPTLFDGNLKSILKDTSDELISGKALDKTHDRIIGVSASTKTFLNKDGSLTKESYGLPRSYKVGNEWKDIDSKLVQDAKTGVWTSGANSWAVTFDKLSTTTGISIKSGEDSLVFTPINGKSVAPNVTNVNSQQVVKYSDVWPDVDITYVVNSAEVKESIIVKSIAAAGKTYDFKVTGASVTPDESIDGFYKLNGVFKDFKIAKSSLATHDKGIIGSEPYLIQKLNNDILSYSLDKNWVAEQTDSAYPLVIDPTVVTQGYGNYVSYRNDGYVCYAGMGCGTSVGNNQPTNMWRAITGPNYNPNGEAQNTNNKLTNASLFLSMAQPGSVATTGTYDPRTITIQRGAYANYYGADNLYGSVTASVGSSATIDVTSIYQNAIANQDYSTNLFLTGDESNNYTFKFFDSSQTKATFTYDSMPIPTLSSPNNQTTVVMPQPHLIGNPTSFYGQTMKYRFFVGTYPNDPSQGQTSNSNWLDTPEWTVPEGAVQNGTTYYWQMQTWNGYGDPNAKAVTSAIRSFKVDLRNGANATQSYDAVGPFTTNLSTGNVSMNAASHSIAALGGNLGLGLNYNSPMRSEPGLMAQYWNDTSNCNCFPSTAATITRVEGGMNFDWGNGSPQPGTINTDHFIARYTGYFVAPIAGTYTFGADADDGVRITADNQTALDSWNYASPSLRYGTQTYSLNSGQVIPLKVEYFDWQGGAKLKLYVKSPAFVDATYNPTGARQVLDQWLQTGSRNIASQQGLTGHYYYSDTATSPTFPSNIDDPARIISTRTDGYLSFNWSNGPPTPNAPAGGYMVKWTGYFTPKVSDTYKFRTYADDGTKLFVNNMTTPLINNWTGANNTTSSGIALTANTRYPIELDYYQNTGSAFVELHLIDSNNVDSIIPANLLTPDSTGLPTGWTVSTSLDASNQYDRGVANGNSMTMSTAAGSTAEYKYVNGSYTPDINDNGHMSTNANGMTTLQGGDGSTTLYNPNGTISSATKPGDSAQAQTSFKYDYVGGRMTKITDGTSTNRYVTILYSGDTNCPTIPTGYVSTPVNMICGVKTSDNQMTQLLYANDGAGLPQLSRIVRPGNDVTDFAYDAQGTGSITQVRDSTANDAIRAGVRTQDNNALTQVTYDALGRGSSVTMPAATSGATRQAHTYGYAFFDPSNPSTPNVGYTDVHVANATEPNGFTRRVEYDKLYRNVKDTNVTNQTTTTAWDDKKDLILSQTDPTGLMTTNIYDYADRKTDTYGPAPISYFNTSTRTPLTSPTDYSAQVAHQSVGYDYAMYGLEANYYTVTNSHGTPEMSGDPKIRATGVPAGNDSVYVNWANTTPLSGPWGVRLTGDLLLPEVGTHVLQLSSNDGARLYINDQLVINDWVDGVYRIHGTYAITTTTSNTHYKVKIEYRDTNQGNARLELSKAAPGGTQTSSLGSLLSPRYGLPSVQTSYDSSVNVGNRKTLTMYGTSPELGLPSLVAVDPDGLNLTTTSTYESPSSTTYYRPTSQAMPNGTATIYAYYGINETMDNPCTTSTVEAFKQGGMPKSKTEPGLSNGSNKVTSMIYDEAGRMLASQTNNDGWSCYSYDARSRMIYQYIPAFNNSPARTVTYDYGLDTNGNAVSGGNPLVEKKTDPEGTITTMYDLIGRITTYSNTYNESTSYTYDSIGRLTGTSSPQYGNETYDYNNLNQLTNQYLDGTKLSSLNYDSFGRLNLVTYPNAGSQKLEIGRDSYGRVNSKKYTLGNGTSVISDNISFSQSGQIVSGTENGVSKSYQYDKAGRLTNATIGSSIYSYGFGIPTNCGAGTNSNSGKNSNRTTATVSNGSSSSTTSYCYNSTDQLVSSSDLNLTTPTYDTHGSTLSLGDTAHKTSFGYDSSDRNTYIGQTGGQEVFMSRDIDGRVKYRSEDTSGNNQQQTWYGFTGMGDNPQYVHRADWTITDKYVTLPGGVVLNIKPLSTGNTQKNYSLTNIQGSTFVVTDTNGNSTATMLYDPFGNLISGTSPANGPLGTTNSYLGSYQKNIEVNFVLKPQQMGDRVYIPTLGRFMQVDPTDGGNPNRYVYPPDPINNNDLDGNAGWQVAAQIGVIGLGIVGGAAVCAATAGIGCVVGAAAIGAATGAGANLIGQYGSNKPLDVGSLAADTALGALPFGAGKATAVTSVGAKASNKVLTKTGLANIRAGGKNIVGLNAPHIVTKGVKTRSPGHNGVWHVHIGDKRTPYDFFGNKL